MCRVHPYMVQQCGTVDVSLFVRACMHVQPTRRRAPLVLIV